MISFMITLKTSGFGGSPRLIPVAIFKLFVSSCVTLICVVPLVICSRLVVAPFSFSMMMISASLARSNAFVMSMKHVKDGTLNSIDVSIICPTTNIASVVDLFFPKSCCSSSVGLMIRLSVLFW